MTASVPPVDLDALETTLAAATPGPWLVLNSRSVDFGYGSGAADYADVGSDHGGVVSSGWCAEEGDQPACETADAAAIVAAVNAAPALIAELRDLREESKKRLDALIKVRAERDRLRAKQDAAPVTIECSACGSIQPVHPDEDGGS